MNRKGLVVAVLLLIAGCLYSNISFAQADKIEGQWYNEEKTAKVEIYKANDQKFWGKIVWLKEPLRDGKPKIDINNPKENARSQPIIGLPILRSFVKSGDNKYTDGQIYDPKNGKTYSCTITYKSDNELSVRGFMGISMIGRTTKWTRAH